MVIESKEYVGKQAIIKTLKLPKIKMFWNQFPDKQYDVNLSMKELTAVCPKTGLPDFYEVTIKYIPDLYLVELKSFKMYLTAFRNIGIFHEHLTNVILNHFVEACEPKEVEITLEVNPRGGITTKVHIYYRRDEEK